MKIRSLFTALLLFSFAAFSSAQTPLSTRAQHADVIVDGTVTSLSSQWNNTHTFIYTTCRVAVHDQLKGNSATEIEFTFAGGRVGNEMMTASSAPAVTSGTRGIFFLDESAGNALTILPGSAGVICYSTSAPAVTDGMQVYAGIAELKNELALISGATWSASPEQNQQSTLRAPSSTASIPVITGFSPGVVRAGTGDVLTITGTGFGAVQGTGKVLFTNADVAGLVRNVEAFASEYLQWDDTLIKVRVPSIGAAGNGTAGTGKIEIVTSTGDNVVSVNNLSVLYAVINLDDNGTVVRPDLVNDNTAGGFTFTLFDTLAQHSVARQTFFHALERWTCATQANYVTAFPGTSTAAAGFDGVNVVRFDSMSTFIMGVVYNFYSMCSGNWYLNESDMVFNNQLTWNYDAGTPAANELDFESNCVTLIGFTLLADHVMDANDVMYSDAPASGLTRRNLVQNNIDGVQSTLSLSTAANSCGPSAHVLNTNCGVGAPLDANVDRITWPYTGFCQGTFPVTAQLINRGLNTLTSAQFNWTYDGVPQTPFAWSGSLLHDDTLAVIIGNVTLTTGTHTLAVWSTSPNASTDDYTDNDTASSVLVIGSCTTANTGVNSLTNPTIAMCPGLHNVSVTVRNYATTPLNYVQIHWKVNGVTQTPYTWTGTVAANSTSPSIVLGTYNFTSYANTIKAWTVYPNGLSDAVPTNDTLNGSYNPNGMIGTYTVGGASPDFANFTTAITNLNNRGLCGSVILDIRPGTYTGAATLTAQTSATKTLLIRAENGDSSSVIITNSSGGVFTINNSDYVTLEKLTFQTTDATTSTVCEITNDANNIDIHNCVFLMPTIALASQNVRGVFISGVPCDSLRIAYCRFENGSSGIITTPSPGTAYNILVEHCMIRNEYDMGINFNYCTQVEIRHCTIDEQNNSAMGIEMQFCTNWWSIHHNTIITKDDIALNIDNCVGSATAVPDVYNNFFSILNYTVGTGVYFNRSSWMNFDHNTISGVCARLFYVSVNINSPLPPHLTVRNNIMSANNQVSRIYEVYNPNGVANIFDVLSHNAYHQGDEFGDLDNFLVSYSLTQWMGFTQSDTGSVAFNPVFTSATDLHLAPNGSNLPVCNSGIPLADISNDIDGNARNSAAPDMGADEFGFNANDASVTQVLPTVRTCIGSNPVTVQITNFGTVPLTSAVIHWTVNSVAQPNFNWNGNLAPNASSGQIAIGNYNFAASTYTIVAWTDQPNAATDAYTANDSYTQTVTGGGMSGVYTIGGASPNYTSITAAKNALITNGVCSHVIFDIRPGTYTEQVVFPVIAGASSTATITFRAENGDSSTVILAGGAGVPVTINAGTYYTFSKVTISGSTNAVSMNDAQHITFSHCDVAGQIVSPINTRNKWLVIEYSRLSLGLEFDSYSVHNGSFWVDYYHEGITIRNNVITYGGLDFNGVTNVLVTDNVFPNVVSQYGITLAKVFDTLIVSGNKIKSFGYHGVDVDYKGGAIFNVPLIANNMILDSSSYSSAIYVETNTSFDILSNTCVTKGPAGGGMTLHATMHMNGLLRVYNNSLTNLQGGEALDLNLGSGSIESDYNALYSTGPYLASLAPGYATLPQWTQATGFDSHSVFALPQFVSAADLHINNDVMLLDAGTPLPEVATDFDGQPRSTTAPDIGADEYTFVPLALDAGVQNISVPFPACTGNAPVSVNIRNYGSTALTSATVNWTVNGILQTPFAWNGNLNLLDSTGLLVIGSYNFIAPDTFTIVAWITSPNSGADQSAVNDTFALYNYIPRLGGVYTIGGSNPDFVTIPHAITVMQQIGLCGNVIFDLRPGNHTWSNTLQNVPGSGPSATITFRSENGDSSSVNLSWIDLGNTSYVTIHQVHVTSNPDMGTNTSHITFTNCWFSSPLVTNGVNNYYLFENCRWSSSTSFSASSSSSPEMGNVFRNNHFENCATLTLYGQRNCLITGNTFDCPTSTSNEALAFNGFRDSCRVTKNYIAGGYQQGIYLNGGSITASQQQLLIANNMIAGNASMSTGIQFSTTSSGLAHVYANNINITSAGPCVGLSNANVSMYNNVLKANTGYAYQVSTAGSLDSANYNDLYTNGATLVRWVSTNCANLAALQAASGGMEMNSVNHDPLYVSPTDLHILNQLLDGAGVARPEVNDDFDSEARMNPPDIGADERNFYPYDAGVVTLVQPVPACEGMNTFSVTIKNFGTQTMTSVDIQWSLNAVMQTPINWTGSLPSGSNVNVVLGNLNLPHASTNQLVVWTENPNAMTDGFNGNDTLTAVIAPRISGVFTIGGSSPDYPDFTSAIADLTAFGVCGPVVFDVRNGVYNEQLSIGIITGSSATNTITFQSEQHDSTLVELSFFSGSANNYVIEISGTNYITFREMTIKALNPLYGKLVFASGTLVRVNFENNYFVGSNNAPGVPFDHVLVRLDHNAGSADCYVRNNYFKDGGVGMFSHGPWTNGDTSSFIIGNRFEDQYLTAIEFEKQYYQVMTYNTITTTSPYTSYKAIWSYLENYEPFIAYNRIMNVLGAGILAEDISGGAIANNFITVQQDPSLNYIYSCMYMTECSYIDVIHNTFISYGNRYFGSAVMISSVSGSVFNNTFKNNIFANMGAGGFAIGWSSQSMAQNNTVDYNAYYTCCSDTLIYCSAVFVDLAAWQAATGRDMNSVTAPPQNISPYDERIFSNVFIDNRGTPVASVPVDLSNQPHGATPDIGADEFTSLTNDIAVVYVRATTAACGGGNVRCAIANFGTNVVTSAEIHWTVNGAPQPVYTWSGTLQPGTYSPQIVLGSYTFVTGDDLDAWTALPNGSPDSYAVTDTARCSVIRTVTLPDLGPDTSVCSGQNFVLTPGSFATYLWSTGATGNSINVSTTGIYSVIVMTSDSCYLYDTISITVLPGPPTPVITQNGANLLSSASTGNQWYFNGNPIAGATGQLYVALQTGQYSVVVTDQNGCTATSAPVVVVGIDDPASGMNGVSIYPNPSDGAFTVTFSSESTTNVVSIYDAAGRLLYLSNNYTSVNNIVTMRVDADLPAGMYLLEIRSGAHVSTARIIIQ